jgi:hypothetical protein
MMNANGSQQVGKRRIDIRQKAAQMEEAISASYDIFGDNAFRKFDGQGYETRFNRAVFDIIVFYFADNVVRKAALAKKTKVKNAYEGSERQQRIR